jgi:hypothetical protein
VQVVLVVVGILTKVERKAVARSLAQSLPSVVVVALIRTQSTVALVALVVELQTTQRVQSLVLGLQAKALAVALLFCLITAVAVAVALVL